MNAEKLDEILRYLKDQCYPERLQDKSSKKAFRRSLKAYRLHDGKVYYHEAAKENKPATLRLVPRGEEEMERVFCECHEAQYGGHVGRDNTLAKIRQRYFWPGYYNDTLDMVSNEKYYLQNCFIEPLLLNNNYFSDQDIFSLATEHRE